MDVQFWEPIFQAQAKPYELYSATKVDTLGDGHQIERLRSPKI